CSDLSPDGLLSWAILALLVKALRQRWPEVKITVRADSGFCRGLFSDRTSCHAWWANQFRLLLSSLAYVLLEALRRLGLSGTQLARAQVETIRLRLLKIGAVITRNTRRIRLWLSSSFPLQQLFCSCLVHFYG